MRDRDAHALARKIADRLDTITDRILPARARLRDWKNEGITSTASSGGTHDPTGHADPVLAAVQRAEITDGPGLDARRVGWRDTDQFDDRLKQMDRALRDLETRTMRLAADVDQILIDSAPLDEHGKPVEVGEDGCQLCNMARLPINALTEQVEHACDADCRARDHRHRDAHQRIHSRRAPKPPFEDVEPVADLPRCAFHYEFAERYGEDAHRDITLWHLDHLGSRVPLVMIRANHEDAHNRRHGTRQSDRVWLGGTRA